MRGLRKCNFAETEACSTQLTWLKLSSSHFLPQSVAQKLLRLPTAPAKLINQ